ncbi:MAG: GIY-YIG nuclease family protein [Gemmataceae bacterium]
MGIVLIIGITLVAFVGAIVCVFYAMEPRRRRVEALTLELEARQEDQLKEQQLLNAREEVVAAEKTRLEALRIQFQKEEEQFTAIKSQVEKSVISYKEMSDENAILKTDLRNLYVNFRKLQLDVESQSHSQEALDLKIKDLGSRYLKENVKWIGSSISPNNFLVCKQRLIDVINRCRSITHEVSVSDEASLLSDLKREYERVVRFAFEREEQARIKAHIREEQLREKEIERELKQLEREREAIAVALAKALEEAKGQHTEEVERLKTRLAEAEEKTKRALSNAQLTKSGHVYVISNLGSFGDGVFKIGMTRRDKPIDRVHELSSASVPFPFDVHLLISSDDAPSMENALHKKLHKMRMNRMNPRKEFFKTTIDSIRQIVKDHEGRVTYEADPEALEYRQSLEMSEDDQEYIENVYRELEEENPVNGDID